jgi:hypothetical protein
VFDRLQGICYLRYGLGRGTSQARLMFSAFLGQGINDSKRRGESIGSLQCSYCSLQLRRQLPVNE